MNSSVRVLIYSHDFAPVPGGAQTYAMLLAEGLFQRCHQVTLVTRTAANGFDDSALSFPVIRTPSFRVLWRLFGNADVVQLTGPAFWPQILGFLLNKPVVIEHHGYQASCPNGLLFYEPSKMVCPGHFMAGRYMECLRCNAPAMGWLRSLRLLLLTFLRRWMAKRAALNTPISHHVLKRIELPRSQVIYYGLPDPLGGRCPPAASSVSSSKPICLAYVGRLVREKGLHLLLGSARRLKDSGYEFRLKFVGDGPERQALETTVNTLGLGAEVVFTGFLQGESLRNMLEDVAAVVMPTIMEETAGLAVMEQMIRGRLVIVADIGGLGEVVDDAGLKFPAGDIEALTTRLRQVLDDPGLVVAVGQKARERAVQLFRQERMVEEHIAVYSELLQEVAQ